MLISTETGPPVNPELPPSYLAVAPSRPTCPRRMFPTRLGAEAWGRRMSVFYNACFAIFRTDGSALTLASLIPPPRYGEAQR